MIAVVYFSYFKTEGPEVLELRNNGKTLKAGDALRKMSVIDLVIGNGKDRYYRDTDNEIETTNEEEELEDAGF